MNSDHIRSIECAAEQSLDITPDGLSHLDKFRILDRQLLAGSQYGVNDGVSRHAQWS